MSDNGYVRLNKLREAISQVKTKLGSDIASAISESASSLTLLINSGDASTLSEAKGYADGLKIIIDSNISSGDSSTLTSANSYTDSKISSVNLTINNLNESIPGQIDLALENYTEYSDFSDHVSDTNNPHQVTKSQIGLSNVDNTSDLNKPISTAVQTALDDLEDRIDAIDEIGSSITLASLGGASATDLTNHIEDTANPHNVTYSQTGAAAASHRRYPL